MFRSMILLNLNPRKTPVIPRRRLQVVPVDLTNRESMSDANGCPPVGINWTAIGTAVGGVLVSIFAHIKGRLYKTGPLVEETEQLSLRIEALERRNSNEDLRKQLHDQLMKDLSSDSRRRLKGES